MDRLLAVKRRELFVGKVDDPHLLLVSERLVDAEHERLPEMAADQKIAEPSAFDRLGAAASAEINEIVGRLDLARRKAEDSADGRAEIETVRCHARFSVPPERIEDGELSTNVDVAEVRMAGRLKRVGGDPERRVVENCLRIMEGQAIL